jgi:hypothetical protein
MSTFGGPGGRQVIAKPTPYAHVPTRPLLLRTR